MTTRTKTCITCHEKKRTDAFNRSYQTLDGRRNICKTCCQAAEKASRRPRTDSEAAQTARRMQDDREWRQLMAEFGWQGRPWNRRALMGVIGGRGA
jgi:hypothetical protein